MSIDEIDEAIKLLSESADTGMTTFNQKFKDAERLGIEALKRVKETRARLITETIILLPGETEE
jgi:hypothetical protein